MALDCKHCIYRASTFDHLGTCGYASVTGKTRTKRDKPIVPGECDYYVKQDKNHPRQKCKSEISLRRSL